MWEKDFGKKNYMFGTETIGTKAYVVGSIDGVDIDPFKTGTTKNYTESPAIFAIDASAGGGPDPTIEWSIAFGKGTAASIVADPSGTHLYVGGNLDEAEANVNYTIGTCSLTGKYGGFLMKLVAATGVCVWATDTPAVGYASSRWGFRYHGLDVDTAGDFVYTVTSSRSEKKFDDSHTIPVRGLNDDGFLAKYSTIDGSGQWVESIGGQGRDSLRDVVTTPDGILIAGTTDSEEVKLGNVKIDNLQHQRADATSGSVSGRSGYTAHFAMMIHAEETISCIDTCTDDTTTAVLKDGFCLIGSTCVANGVPA